VSEVARPRRELGSAPRYRAARRSLGPEFRPTIFIDAEPVMNFAAKQFKLYEAGYGDALRYVDKIQSAIQGERRRGNKVQTRTAFRLEESSSD
jgi:hypothetical protein